MSAVDEVAVGIGVRDAAEVDFDVKVDTGGVAEVHVSFDPNEPKLVVMAVVKVLAKDRAALTITLGLLKSNLVT